MNSPLQGGQMRRRQPPRRRTVLMPLLLVLFVAAGVVAWLVTSDRGTGTQSAPAIHEPVLPARGAGTPESKPSGKAPPPGITLIGAKPVKLRFHKPPRAGLLFDLDSGQAL